jgi:hypothetical protein
MKNWVSFLLIMLIAVQSVLAVADTHEINPSDIGHHEFEGRSSHASDAEDPVDLNQSSGDTLDCQHCSHFHSAQLNLLPGMASNLVFDAAQLHFSDRSNAAGSSHSSSLFRPPRA